MIDSVPDAPQAYVQMVDKSDAKVSSLLDDAVSKCHDDRCKGQLSQAINGIYQRGYQAYIPRESLRRFDVTAPRDPNHPIEPTQTTIMRHGAFSEKVGLEDYAKQYEAWIQKGELTSSPTSIFDRRHRREGRGFLLHRAQPQAT
ncbi:hypothetical protein [Pseudomonas amygdali]|uniref:hypothetical protein n=2 Tax=Pseudomonas amygdali TaxID=47877 RepID=UPI000B2EC168|nr:hypothetical protein [Pseudomonas amygdali]